MSANYRLPSLELGTRFDPPIRALEVPGELGRGSDTALCILDGATRAPHRVSRLVRPSGLLGVKLARPEQAVRITLRLLADQVSTAMWQRHVTTTTGAAGSEEDTEPDVSGRHRLAEVTLQGRPAGLVMLTPRLSDDDSAVRQVIRLELHPEDVDDSGLVMVGLQHPEGAPAWMERDALPDGLVGVCVARMHVEVLEHPVHPGLATGRPQAHGTSFAGVRPGGFVVNPGAGPATVALRELVGGEDRLRGRRARVRHPVRAVGQLVADRRTASDADALVDVVDRAGRVVLDGERVSADDGRHVVRLPAGTGPVFVRVRRARPDGSPAPVDWQVSVRAGDA